MGAGKGDVAITFETMTSKSKQLTEQKKHIDEKLDDAQKFVDDLLTDGFVTEKASKAFDESYTAFTKGAKEAIEGLEGMATFLKKAAKAFQALDDHLEKGIKKH
ncbi:WXG100 family type VII secretion target [Streptomyces sp. H27-D2]|uniref:WXG100 family type VII secretion target n=1 Tax=Streptomyces sp. H27-D2 TaxID=3046304 RepID=UPI002DBBBAD6|nr:WXG100 family type VII secretion target [Streptomyces sp. H27-D2]MEC4016508.1 WXG100 family type VII secretion target [Streptomyces sp. H27-D2]